MGLAVLVSGLRGRPHGRFGSVVSEFIMLDPGAGCGERSRPPPPGTNQTNLTCRATDASSVLGSESPACNPLCASDLLVAFACLRLSLLICKMGFGPEFGLY